MNDMELVREYAASQSEQAFETLVDQPRKSTKGRPAQPNSTPFTFRRVPRYSGRAQCPGGFTFPKIIIDKPSLFREPVVESAKTACEQGQN
jgi:hypothetical protein